MSIIVSFYNRIWVDAGGSIYDEPVNATTNSSTVRSERGKQYFIFFLKNSITHNNTNLISQSFTI